MYLRDSCDKCCTDETEDDRPARHQCIMWMIAAAEVKVPNVVHAALHTHTHTHTYAVKFSTVLLDFCNSGTIGIRR